MKKICLVSSPGGHLTMMMRLKPWWKRLNRFWVTHREVGSLYGLSEEKIYAACFPENRNFANFFRNLMVAWTVLRRENPDLIVSMGAGVAVPFMLVGKILGIRTVFIEPLVFIGKPTLSGRILYRWVSDFVVQNRKLLRYYPDASLTEWKV